MNNDIEWLENLQESIWINVYGRRYENPEVTEAVLNTVFDIIERHRLPVLIHNTGMGFSVGLTVYDNPVYPGVGPKVILKINNNHLGKNKRFEDGWKAFYPFVNRNQDLLTESLEDKGYYDY